MILHNILDFITLSLLEIVLGVDNLIFIALITQQLPAESAKWVKNVGLTLAIGLRIGLLFMVKLIMKMTTPLLEIYSFSLTGRKLLLIAGGIFLIYKATIHLYELLKNEIETKKVSKQSTTMALIQIIFIDLVLSFDSVIIAIGLSENLSIIIGAIFVSLIFMIFLMEKINKAIAAYPSIKIIALNFICLLGFFLTLNGFDIIFSKNYLYFAMGFSLLNEIMVIAYRKKKGLQ